MIDWEKLVDLLTPKGNVVKVECDGEVLWEKGGLPSEYQQVEWVQAASNTGTYIDLGFTFDTACRVAIEYWVTTTGALSTYPFGATENSGKLRCILSCPYSTSLGGMSYGSTGSAYNQTVLEGLVLGKNIIELVWKKGEHSSKVDDNGKKMVTTQGEYTMTNHLYLFAQNYNGSPRFGGVRQIGYFKYYDKNDCLICDLVPCFRKADGVVGMYDLARRLFLTNVGAGNFIAGPEISGGY